MGGLDSGFQDLFECFCFVWVCLGFFLGRSLCFCVFCRGGGGGGVEGLRVRGADFRLGV